MDRALLSKLAYEGKELPDGLSCKETYLFMSYRNLYAFAKDGKLTKEQGAAEKKKIEQTSIKFEEDTRLIQHCAHLMLATGQARAEYRKAATDNERITAAKKIVEALDNVGLYYGNDFKKKT